MMVKKIKIVAYIVLAAAILGPVAILYKIKNEISFFGTGGIAHFTWIALLCILIESVTMIFGRVLEKKRVRFIPHYVVPGITIPLLLCVGFCSFLFGNLYSYDTSNVVSAQQKIRFEIPDHIDVVTNKTDILPMPLSNYAVSYVKLLSREERAQFEEKIQQSSRWTDELNSTLKNSLPLDIQAELSSHFDHYLYYNATTKEYNIYPILEGTYDCVFVAYNHKRARLIVLNEYHLTVD